MMSSHCIVPKWNLSHQRRQEQAGEAAVHGERNRSSSSSSSHPHVHSDHNLSSYVVPMANYEVTELTWENGQLALHGLGGSILPQVNKQTTTWEKPGDHTLESIVHQATFPSFHQNQAKNSATPKWGEQNSSSQMHIEHNLAPGNWREISGRGTIEQNLETSMSSMVASSGDKWRELQGMMDELTGSKLGENTGLVNKRVRSEAPERVKSSIQEAEDRAASASASGCASASAAFCRETDTTMMTWNTSESARSLKSARNAADDDSACHLSNSENQEGERMNKGESLRRRSRAAAIHNQSERRRRDRINEKMRALQKLVPNANKTDKASMLDEVIEYLKQLQAQIQFMTTARNMPQMVMQQQQQLQQMSLLAAARMGMGIGMGMGVPGMPMGMLDVNNLARNVPHSLPPLTHSNATTSFVSPPFSMPPVVPNQLKPNIGDHPASISNFNDAYQSLFAQQSMNMDFFNKMAALYRQQACHQTSKKPVTLSQPNNAQTE